MYLKEIKLNDALRLQTTDNDIYQFKGRNFCITV